MADYDCSSSAAEEKENYRVKPGTLQSAATTVSIYIWKPGFQLLVLTCLLKVRAKPLKKKKPPSTIFYGLNLQDSFFLINGFPISSPNMIM